MLLLYSDIDSPRVDYIFKLVFTELLGLPFEQTRQKELFKNHAGPTLGYSASRVNNEFFICCTNFLKPGPVLPFEVPVAAGEQIHLFPTDGSDLPFDVFAAVFYMVSRYEEYLPFVPDQHGRFTSSSSLASKHNFVLKPVVNEWVALALIYI